MSSHRSRTLRRAGALVGALLLAAAPAAGQGAPRTFVGTPFTYADGSNGSSGGVTVADVFPVQSISVHVGLQDAVAPDTRLMLSWLPAGSSNTIQFELFPMLAGAGAVRSFDGLYTFTSLPGGAFPGAQQGAIAPGAYHDRWLAQYFADVRRPGVAGTYRLTMTDYERGNGGGEVTSFAIEFDAAVSTVPEPATAVLLAPFLVAGAVIARRRGRARLSA